MLYPNIYSLFRTQTAKYGDKPVFFTRRGNDWTPRTWADFEDTVHNLACALLAKGLTGGSSVAILAGSIPEWSIFDIATIAAGGVGVGIYPTSSAEQARFVIDHSGAEFVFVDTAEQLGKLTDTSNPLPSLKGVICLEEQNDSSFEAVGEGSVFRHIGSVSDREVSIMSFREFLDFGKTRRHEYLPRVERTGFDTDAESTAITVYTSGTTGEPKGAMLSHRYILNSVRSLRQAVPIFDTDRAISYLPGCHVAERISGIYNRLYNGTPAWFINDLSRLYEYMLEIRPTVFASLPRFFEKIHAKVINETGPGAVDSQTVKDAFGGAVGLLTSGGAPLPLEIADFFSKHDLPILQAYGLTENICVAFNTVAEHKYGTVGKPMPMCRVKIAADGEILVKSAMMFSGYYKEPEKTAEMFDADGWLMTGDLGELDQDGFLTITGRKKEIIVLSTGKNVAPALVENYVRESHLVSHCFLYGDGRSHCVALITINQAEAAEYTAEQMNVSVGEIVAMANARLSGPEQIKKFVILESDFSADADEITPTLKLKRRVVAEHYKDILEKLYE